MSKAGIDSNRGDGYQTLVAFNWALIVLSDPDYQWLEIDSVTWSVDDVVIGKIDGSKICCQCKKNQTQHKAWSISDLKDELCKAIGLLNENSETTVRFYSRSNFGDFAALREFSSAYADESAYHSNMGKAHIATNAELDKLLSENNSNNSTYQFLQRIKFEVSPELDTMVLHLRERLRQLVSNHSVAFDALWTRLDQLGMRINGQSEVASTQHRLMKADLITLINKGGSVLTPPIEIGDIRSSFHSVSAIGRSWRRDIANEVIATPEVNEVLKAIEDKNRSILVTGIPGSGKTCVMLAVQDELERIARSRTDLQPLFIQSREFADLITPQDRYAQGLPEHWVERAARMAENAHVVVIIDSLDVLSIAREHSVLQYFLAQIDRLLLIENITVVTSCREFDSHYDRRIAHREWAKKISCSPLSWDENVVPLLIKLKVDISVIDATTKELICNPRELALFIELAQKGGSFNVLTSNALAQRYLANIVQVDGSQGDAAMMAIESMATEMLQRRSLAVPHQRFSASQEIKRKLLSNKVLHETQDEQLTFGHQTLLDVLVINGAIRQAVTL
ncbi:MAG TPA: AAA family ATPase, partial [Cellvibrio sp.]